MVDKQAVRQQAPSAAAGAQTRLREQRVERERRCSALGIQVAAALAERDAHTAAYEQGAAVALRPLVEDERLTLIEAIEWCGGSERLPMAEAVQLRRLAPPAPVDPTFQEITPVP